MMKSNRISRLSTKTDMIKVSVVLLIRYEVELLRKEFCMIILSPFLPLDCCVEKPDIRRSLPACLPSTKI
jgi:hypothetical protein